MIDFTTFATRAKPLRASSLPKLVACPLGCLMSLVDEESVAGQAADTGSAVHMAARAWHTLCGKDTRAALAVMQGALGQYPQADLDSAAEQFQWYAKDPRNQEAEIILCEAQVTVAIPPCEDDPTEEEVCIVGHVDQVRKEGNNLIVWDIKTGKRLYGLDMLNEYAFQLVGYQLAAEGALKQPVKGAGIIRTQDYLMKARDRRTPNPGPVFWKAPWRYRDLPGITRAITRVVSMIRQGKLYIGPGEHCRWCKLGGVGNCVPELIQLGVRK